jgi:heterotetrameric sarcosine oxidase delta subunit
VYACAAVHLWRIFASEEIDAEAGTLDAKLSDAEWAEWLFVRDNPKGRFAERWVHTHGCRRWFDLVRDTEPA